MAYENIKEEESLKIKVATDYFPNFDYKTLGKIDFQIAVPNDTIELFETESLLWAEAKKGKSDIYKSIVQLILTIGKAKTFNDYLPPAYLGALDTYSIAFVPYNAIHEIFYQNDFNWNVTPSNHETKEFLLVLNKVKNTISLDSLIFNFETDSKEIKEFIKTNFIVGRSKTSKVRIDKNNYVNIYLKWLEVVKPTIAVDWDLAKNKGILDCDFYFADLLSKDNLTLQDGLSVLLKNNKYELDRTVDEVGFFASKTAIFTDSQKAHLQFWNKYERPPDDIYTKYILDGRHLLVPQDIRERKGSFFTPQIWVNLSQKYLANYLGENWQDEYTVWDCAAGTGNLLVGLDKKYNLWASTLDKQDVDIMHDRIDNMNKNSLNGNGSNLLKEHVFQFDFLNDSFDKLPNGLKEIINHPEKRKKLIIYINPPYAEARGEKLGKNNLKGVNLTLERGKYSIGNARVELFAQFLIRIYTEIPDCIIGEFSKLKTLNAPNFKKFRGLFLSKLEKCFVIQADTFDNVKGKFPIGFKIWNNSKKEHFKQISADVYNKKGDRLNQYSYYNYDGLKFINDWIKPFNGTIEDNIGGLIPRTNDFQHQNFVMVVNTINLFGGSMKFYINKENLIIASIYYAVRHSVKANWLNDRDQFLFPNKKWEKDKEFQSDCLTYTLFKNNIQSKYGTNHWIPFTENEVNARTKFESNFMTEYFSGNYKFEKSNKLFENKINIEPSKIEFSNEAKLVLNAGKELFKYYHQSPSPSGRAGEGLNANASLYDIKEYFQGRNESGKMNNKSSDEFYNKLNKELKESLEILEIKLQPKVYEYGFLMR